KAEALKAEAARAEKANSAAEAAKAEAAKAEAAKAAAQAEIAKAEAARAEAQAEIAKAQAAKTDAAKAAAQAEAAKAEQAQRLASANTASVPPQTIDPGDLTRLLQIHLKRVGCDPGSVEGNWSAQSRRAMETFNKNAGTALDVTTASLASLDVVRGKNSRVCPLVCDPGQRLDGERCVPIACDAGFVLGSDGACKKRPDPPKTAERPHNTPSPAPKSGGKCFVFNGKQFCE